MKIIFYVSCVLCWTSILGIQVNELPVLLFTTRSVLTTTQDVNVVYADLTSCGNFSTDATAVLEVLQIANTKYQYAYAYVNNGPANTGALQPFPDPNFSTSYNQGTTFIGYHQPPMQNLTIPKANGMKLFISVNCPYNSGCVFVVIVRYFDKFPNDFDTRTFLQTKGILPSEEIYESKESVGSVGLSPIKWNPPTTLKFLISVSPLSADSLLDEVVNEIPVCVSALQSVFNGSICVNAVVEGNAGSLFYQFICEDDPCTHDWPYQRSPPASGDPYLDFSGSTTLPYNEYCSTPVPVKSIPTTLYQHIVPKGIPPNSYTLSFSFGSCSF